MIYHKMSYGVDVKQFKVLHDKDIMTYRPVIAAQVWRTGSVRVKRMGKYSNLKSGNWV